MEENRLLSRLLARDFFSRRKFLGFGAALAATSTATVNTAAARVLPMLTDPASKGTVTTSAEAVATFQNTPVLRKNGQLPSLPEAELVFVNMIRERAQSGQIDIRDYGSVTVGAEITESQAIQNSTAINSAIQAAGDAGGAEIVIPSLIVVGYGGTTQGKDYCIRFNRNCVAVVGRSQGRSELRVYGDDGALGLLNLHVGDVDNSNPDLSRATLRNLILNGNYTGTVSGASLIAAEGLQFCNFENLELRNAGGYLFGLQNGGYLDNTFRNIIGIGCVRDGFDVKDNGSISAGNVIDNLMLRECGRGADLEDPWACLDLLGIGWRVSNIDILVNGGGSTAAAVRFKQGVISTNRGPASSYSSVNNLVLRQAAGGSSIPCRGIHVKGPHVTIGSSCSMRGFTNAGIVTEQPFVSIGAVQIDGENTGGDGISFTSKTSTDQEFPGADDCTAIGAVVRNCSSGIVSSRVRTKLVANSVDSCTNGIVQSGAGGTNMRVYFNEVTNCPTPMKFNNTSSNRIFANEGFNNPKVLATVAGGVIASSAFTSPGYITLSVGSEGAELAVLRAGDSVAGQMVRVYGATTVGGSPRLSAVGAGKSLELDTESGAPVIIREPVRLPSFPAEEIASAAHSVNTVGKAAGNQIWDTTNNRVMVSSGAVAGSPWYVSDGSDFITPS